MKPIRLNLAGLAVAVAFAGIALAQEREDRTLLSQSEMAAIINEV